MTDRFALGDGTDSPCNTIVEVIGKRDYIQSMGFDAMTGKHRYVSVG